MGVIAFRTGEPSFLGKTLDVALGPSVLGKQISSVGRGSVNVRCGSLLRAVSLTVFPMVHGPLDLLPIGPTNEKITYLPTS
jgi:hypothetical protein